MKKAHSASKLGENEENFSVALQTAVADSSADCGRYISSRIDQFCVSGVNSLPEPAGSRGVSLNYIRAIIPAPCLGKQGGLNSITKVDRADGCKAF